MYAVSKIPKSGIISDDDDSLVTWIIDNSCAWKTMQPFSFQEEHLFLLSPIVNQMEEIVTILFLFPDEHTSFYTRRRYSLCTSLGNEDLLDTRIQVLFGGKK